MTKKLKCYLYTRVSTEIQLDGYSLEAQKDRLRREAAHRGMKVVGEYSDEGKSGKNIKGRPAFQQMLTDIKEKKDDVDYVLVFKLSRFGRNAADTLNSLQYMEDYGVHLLCVEDGIDSAGAAGKLMVSVLAAVAEIERENIKEQTMAGRQQKARDGRWNGGFAPYGYKLVAVDGQKSKSLVINEEEAPLIRMIYDKYLNGNMGITGTAKWLNEHGYTKTPRQNGTITGISTSFVKGVLDNPVYCGKIAYGRRRTEKIDGTRNEFHITKQPKDSYKLYEGEHEGIISEDDWYQVQVKRAKNAFKREKTHSLEHCHILSGLVKCPVCGAPMYGVVNRKKKKGSEEFYKDMWYYHCKNRRMVTGHPCDYKKNIPQEQLNQEVFALFRYAYGGDNNFRDGLQKKYGSSEGVSELMREKEHLEQELEKLESQKKKQLIKIDRLDIDDEFYDDLLVTYKEGLREITDKIAGLNATLYQTEVAIDSKKGESFSYEMYIRAIDSVLNLPDEIPDEEAKRIMNFFIEKIEVYPERQPDGRWVRYVKFKIPLNMGGEDFDIICYEDDNSENNSLPKEAHVETVVLLSKLNAKQHIEVELNLDELDLTAAESKATYDEIKAYVLERYGLKVSSLYISQVKRKCGLDVGQNYNLSKKEDTKVPQCPPEKEAAIVEALKHFHMI